MNVERGELVAVALLVLSPILGACLFVLGFILQINLLGHGPFTSVNYFGVLLMFVGPAIGAAGSVLAFCLSRADIVRMVAGTTATLAALLLLVIAFTILKGQSEDTRRLTYHRTVSSERQESYQLYKEVRAAAEEHMPQILIVGHYEAKDGTLVDGFALGPPDAFSPANFSVSSGELSRFTWVHPVYLYDRAQATGPIPPYPEEFLDHSTPVNEENVRIRRFLVLLTDARGDVTLHTRYGDLPLPGPTPQPLLISLEGPVTLSFADQVTLRAKRLRGH